MKSNPFCVTYSACILNLYPEYEKKKKKKKKIEVKNDNRE